MVASSPSYSIVTGNSQTIAGLSDATGAGVVENTEKDSNYGPATLTINNAAADNFSGVLGGSGNGPAGMKLALGGNGNGPAGIAFAVQAVTTSNERTRTLMIFNEPGRMRNSPPGDSPAPENFAK